MRQCSNCRHIDPPSPQHPFNASQCIACNFIARLLGIECALCRFGRMQCIATCSCVESHTILIELLHRSATIVHQCLSLLLHACNIVVEGVELGVCGTACNVVGGMRCIDERCGVEVTPSGRLGW